jgi:3-phosphoshikimate 1-carboxyvinyltransferase
MRLLAGILAGQPFRSVLTGNDSLRRRPMDRIALPLRVMGAHVETTEGRPPLEITGGPLCPIDYTLPVASAQVKSAILLAGLYARGPTTVREPALSRDHTERMLQAMGAHLTVDGLAVTLHPGSPLHARDTVIPGDISSAAFLLAAALLLPGSEVVLEGVGVNPTRTGILDVLGGMGAEVVLENPREVGGEPVADLTVRRSRLRATHIGGPLIPRLIDELPLIALVATQAEGVTVVQDAAELRVKESDRIATTVAELRKLGADIEARPDGFVIRGPTPLRGAEVESHGDHRLAMTLTVAGLIARGETVVQDTECIGDSFPGFEETLSYLGARLEREGDIDRG